MAKYSAAELRELQQSDPRLISDDPPCLHCKHLIEVGLQEGDAPEALTGWLCSAYPEGIYKMILRRQLRHTEPVLGQEGDDVFEPIEIEFYDGLDTVDFDGNWASHQKGE